MIGMGTVGGLWYSPVYYFPVVDPKWTGRGKRGTGGRFLKRKRSRRKCRKWNNIIPWLSYSSSCSFCGHNTYHSFVLFPLHPLTKLNSLERTNSHPLIASQGRLRGQKWICFQLPAISHHPCSPGGSPVAYSPCGRLNVSAGVSVGRSVAYEYIEYVAPF